MLMLNKSIPKRTPEETMELVKKTRAKRMEMFSEMNKYFSTKTQISNKNLEKVLVFSSENEIFVIDYNDLIYPIASRTNWVRTLCSHNGQLYDGGDYKKIFETVSGKEITSRREVVRTLCSHNGQLYDGGDYEQIYETLTRKVTSFRYNFINSLCSHNGQLYDNGFDGGESYKIIETFSGKRIAKGDKRILSLCSHPREYFVNTKILKT